MDGPAPLKPFTENRYHYKWHWLWDFGNGDLGNQGIHELDICRWGLGVTYPTKVTAIGGHFMFDDDQETPNTLTALYEFNDGGKKKMMEFAVRHWMSNHEAGIDEGKIKAEFEKGPVETPSAMSFTGRRAISLSRVTTLTGVCSDRRRKPRAAAICRNPDPR